MGFVLSNKQPYNPDTAPDSICLWYRGFVAFKVGALWCFFPKPDLQRLIAALPRVLEGESADEQTVCGFKVSTEQRRLVHMPVQTERGPQALALSDAWLRDMRRVLHEAQDRIAREPSRSFGLNLRRHHDPRLYEAVEFPIFDDLASLDPALQAVLERQRAA